VSAGKRIPVRGPGNVGPWASSEAGPIMTPAAFLLFFIPFPFLFLNSVLIQNFCIFDSIQFKQILKIF
jgi:hypothetical protein